MSDTVAEFERRDFWDEQSGRNPKFLFGKKASFEVFFMAIRSDHFQNDEKPYNKRIDVFLRQL